ncbi:MAG: PKD domain-containing protein, partial [Planctomycetota bacterium]
EAKLVEQDGVTHVVYHSTYNHTDEHLYVRPEGGIEHDIILKKQPVISNDCGLAYSGYLTLGDGLTMWDGKKEITGNYTTKNGIHFKDRNKNPIFYLRTPIAYDATVTLNGGGLDKEKQAIQENQRRAITCEYQLTFDEKGVKLAVVTPGAWLSASERAYPVTIDPNFGPNGFADGNPPIYTGTVGSGVLIPLVNGGSKLKIDSTCAGRPDNGFGHIPMPFDFTFYGVTYPGPASPTGFPQVNFFVHIDGWGSWDPPGVPPFCDELICDPAENPCLDNPSAANGNGAIPNGAYPNDGALYVLWNNLRFSNADPQSAIYYLIDGVAPNRRLIIEWHRMQYVASNNAQDVISFNLILYECQSVIEMIIGDVTLGNKYFGLSTSGIESPGDTLAVVYDTYAPPAAGQPATIDVNGLDLQFSQSPLGTVTTGATNTTGCIPLRTCFTSSVDTTIPLCVQLAGGQTQPPSYSFHWTFGDGGEAFTANVCHTYVSPNAYNSVPKSNNPTLTVTNEFGNASTFTNLTVLACDIPPVFMTVSPMGGPAPLQVDVRCVSTTPYVPDRPSQNVNNIQPVMIQSIQTFSDATTGIQIDQLGPQNEPGQFTPYQTILGATGSTANVVVNRVLTATPVETIQSTVFFDTPGMYRVRGMVNGTSFTLPTTGNGDVFVDVTDPNSSTSNLLIITNSTFKINWAGKLLNAVGIQPNPASDTLTVSGYLNLTGFDLSMLTGQQITLALNAFNPIFEGVLNANGTAVQGDAVTGKTGSFAISMPSGKFTCSVKGDFAASLGLTDQNLISLMPAHYRVQIGNVYNTQGTSVSYGYSSIAGKQALGNYEFGKFFTKGPYYSGNVPGAPGKLGQPGGQELLISGGFMVTSASFKLLGDTVTASISGLLARAGGDDLRPAATSNVVVKIGNMSETLNFSTTPKFKATGKPPAQKFSFVSKGGTSIKTLSWLNKQGNFAITTFVMPNASVGINPLLGRQPISLSFTVTPDNATQYTGTTVFDIIKVSDTDFKH